MGLLVISRKRDESLVVNGPATLIVQRIQGNRVSLAIDAPATTHVVRGELFPKETNGANGGDSMPSTSPRAKTREQKERDFEAWWQREYMQWGKANVPTELPKRTVRAIYMAGLVAATS